MNNEDKYSVSYSWTQPYVSMNPLYQYNELTVKEEIERLNEIDDQVMLMDNYPDAEQLIRNIMK
jgi:spore coat protein CotF